MEICTIYIQTENLECLKDTTAFSNSQGKGTPIVRGPGYKVASISMVDVSSSDFDNIKKDISLISNFSSEILRDLTTQTLDFLLQPTKSSFQDFLGDLAEKQRSVFSMERHPTAGFIRPLYMPIPVPTHTYATHDLYGWRLTHPFHLHNTALCPSTSSH